MKILDVHTHNLSHDAIVSKDPEASIMDDYLYSVGVHPWSVIGSVDYEILKEKCSDKRVIAIGECGLDFHRKEISQKLQEEIFIRHIEISEELKKPMIIHCVNAHNQLLSLYKKYKPNQAWIIHGFRQKPSIAIPLIEAGMYLSLGSKFNSETAKLIPSDKLLIETDDSHQEITEVAKSVAMVINKNTYKLIGEIEENLKCIFKF